jgi:hypothetical protein
MNTQVQTKRKSINIQDFLSRRSVDLKKKETKQTISKKDVPNKTASVIIPEIKTSEKKKITPITPILEKNKSFKFIQADSIRDPLKLLSFIEWLSIPPQERNLKTQQELAIKIGVSVDTLTDWKKLLGFWDEVAIYRSQYFRKYTSGVNYALAQKAKTGNPKAVELFMSLFEGYKQKIGVEKYETTREITDEEKDKIDKALKNIGLASIIENGKKYKYENQLDDDKLN